MDRGCQIVLNHFSVSERHARFTLTDAGVLVEDQRSRRGTFVNGELVVNALLRPGDRVQIGWFNLILLEGPPDLTADVAVLTAAREAGRRPSPISAIAPAPVAPSPARPSPRATVAGEPPAGPRDQTGSRVGAFELQRLLAQEGRYASYEAQAVTSGERIFLELTDPIEDAALFERLLGEALRAEELRHTGIVHLLGAGANDRCVYLAMAFPPRGDLLDFIWTRNRDRSWRTCLDSLDPVVDAVGFAHSRGVVHGDITPRHVQFAPPAGPRVEFARLALLWVRCMPRRRQRGDVIGDIIYMSPEELLGGAVDARSDVFRLGLILYEMIAGRRPFAADNAMASAYHLVNSEPEPLGPAVPPALDDVIRRALEKAPERRPADALELGAALRVARHPLSGSS
jgi:pSer/pThr/pTyr-binding forkhead associated (FHA) protein